MITLFLLVVLRTGDFDPVIFQYPNESSLCAAFERYRPTADGLSAHRLSGSYPSAIIDEAIMCSYLPKVKECGK